MDVNQLRIKVSVTIPIGREICFYVPSKSDANSIGRAAQSCAELILDGYADEMKAFNLLPVSKRKELLNEQ